MFKKLITWAQDDLSKKIILLSFGLGTFAVLLSLLLTLVLLGYSTNTFDCQPSLLPTLLMMGHISKFLFQFGPILLLVSGALALRKKFQFIERRKKPRRGS